MSPSEMPEKVKTMKQFELRLARGFTLLEMLVVLLIAGMALALTSQALSQYRRAHERVSASTQGGREYRMAERWFRDSVSGLYAVGPPGTPGAPAKHAGHQRVCRRTQDRVCRRSACAAH